MELDQWKEVLTAFILILVQVLLAGARQLSESHVPNCRDLSNAF
jgi:hypothetical protein